MKGWAMAHSKMQLTTKISGERAMRARRLFPVIYCLSFLTSFSVVLGDGKVFIWRNKDADIFQPTQKAFIKWDGSEEKLLLQTKYEGPAEEMVWIVPVPSEPKVKKGDPNAFERLSKETQYPDLAYTHFWRLSISTAPAAGMSGKQTAVKWRRQIGDYDVALLSPVGREHVIQWLNSNEFGVPEEAVPILQDYIKDQWWVVAARIHPDALTDITRVKLTEGTLHPLEMIFKAPKCVYPLRLTSLVAGPVEELIYIEGPAHYEPVTLRNDWEMDVFGGPGWKPPIDSLDKHELSEYFAGRLNIRTDRHLTKLRRVFKPQDMTEDIIFEKLDYAKIYSSGVPLHIGQAATQYGRHRDASGVSLLLESLAPIQIAEFQPAIEDYEQRLPLSAGILSWQGISRQKKKCEHLRSCIWALGEIAIEHGLEPAAEQTLLRCSKHENQLIRMEAYAALAKLDVKGIGPILLNRFKQIFSGELTRLLPTSAEHYYDDNNIIAEMAVTAEWIKLSGTAQQKDIFIEALSNLITRLPVDPRTDTSLGGGNTSPGHTIPWIVWQAALTQDPHLLRPLENYRARYPETDRYHIEFLLKAEAACGSREAISTLARQIAEDQGKVLSEREAHEDGGYASLQPFYQTSRRDSIRTWILRKREHGKESYRRMPTTIDDAIIRTALSEHELDDWYVLYLLSYIEESQAADTKRIRIIWDKKDSGKQLVAVAVLWTWKDTKTLLELHEQCADEAVAAEIQRVLDSQENQGD